jgi:hypothetical protein
MSLVTNPIYIEQESYDFQPGACQESANICAKKQKNPETFIIPDDLEEEEFDDFQIGIYDGMMNLFAKKQPNPDPVRIPEDLVPDREQIRSDGDLDAAACESNQHLFDDSPNAIRLVMCYLDSVCVCPMWTSGSHKVVCSMCDQVPRRFVNYHLEGRFWIWRGSDEANKHYIQKRLDYVTKFANGVYERIDYCYPECSSRITEDEYSKRTATSTFSVHCHFCARWFENINSGLLINSHVMSNLNKQIRGLMSTHGPNTSKNKKKIKNLNKKKKQIVANRGIVNRHGIYCSSQIASDGMSVVGRSAFTDWPGNVCMVDGLPDGWKPGMQICDPCIAKGILENQLKE